MSIIILSSGSAFPNNIISNKDLENTIDTSDSWIRRKIGVSQRYVLSENESFIDYCYKAAVNAINNARISKKNVSLIIIATSTPQQIMPSTASILQGMLKIPQAISFDLQASCSGFIYALSIAYSLMCSNESIKYALVMGCEAFSKIIDWNDRRTCTIFGDGFAGMILGRHKNKEFQNIGIKSVDFSCDGRGRDHLQVPWGIAQGFSKISKISPYFTMIGKLVFERAINSFIEQINCTLKKNYLTISDINWIIPHQANVQILERIIKYFAIPSEKMIITINQYGNTSAASIPLSFDYLVNKKAINKGDLVLFIGFGAGYTWGNVLVRF